MTKGNAYHNPEPLIREWTVCASVLPANGQVVETKIDDAKGCRNVALLKRRGNLWFFPDESMYVYYTPTHWRETALSFDV